MVIGVEQSGLFWKGKGTVTDDGNAGEGQGHVKAGPSSGEDDRATGGGGERVQRPTGQHGAGYSATLRHPGWTQRAVDHYRGRCC